MEGMRGNGRERQPGRLASGNAGVSRSAPEGNPISEGIRGRREGLVLMAEDSKDTRESYGLFFEVAAGGAVDFRTAKDGFEALRIFSENQVSIVFSDMHMVGSKGDEPGNGIWLVREIRKADPEVPIIIISGGASDEEKAAAFSAGISEFLLKPVEMGLLAQIIMQYSGQEIDIRR